MAFLKTARGLNASVSETWLFQFVRASLPLEYPAVLLEAVFDATVSVSGAQKTRADLSVLLSVGGRLQLTEQVRFEGGTWHYSNLLFYEVRVGDEIRITPLEASRVQVTL